jgi:phage tail protein X
MATIDRSTCPIFIAADGDRLDTIVYRHYGTLDVFEAVLAVNARLDPILKDGDIVFLPPIAQEEKGAELW